MDKKQPNFVAFQALAAFATDSEGDLENLSAAELQERLTRQGIDPQDLAKRVQLRLKRLRNEMDARQAQAAAAQKKALPIERSALRHALRGMQPIAARTEDQADEDDLEVIARLTQEDVPDDHGA
jgi:hypothetical protein